MPVSSSCARGLQRHCFTHCMACLKLWKASVLSGSNMHVLPAELGERLFNFLLAHNRTYLDSAL